MTKHGTELAWETILVGMILIIATALLFRAAFIGENAWLPRAGIISNQTANSLEILFGPGLRLGEADVLQESDLTSPPKFKFLYDSLKNNIEAYQKSPDQECYIAFDYDAPLEEGYSLSFRRSGQDINLILTKARTLLIENDVITDLNICTVAAKNIQSKKTPEVFQFTRLDIEPLKAKSYIFFDGKLDADKQFFLENKQGKVVLYKQDEDNICIAPFQVSTKSISVIGWIMEKLTIYRASDLAFFIEYSEEDNFYKPGSLFYKPKCRLKLPEHQYLYEQSLSDGTKLTVTTILYSREEMTDEEKEDYNKLFSTFFIDYFKQVPISEAVKMNSLDLKNQIKSRIKSQITEPAINYEIAVKVEKSGNVISMA